MIQNYFLFKMSHLSLTLHIFLSSVLLLLDTSFIDLFLGPLVGYNSGLNMAADLGPVLALFNSIFAFLHNVTVLVQSQKPLVGSIRRSKMVLDVEMSRANVTNKFQCIITTQLLNLFVTSTPCMFHFDTDHVKLRVKYYLCK